MEPSGPVQSFNGLGWAFLIIIATGIAWRRAMDLEKRYKSRRELTEIGAEKKLLQSYGSVASSRNTTAALRPSSVTLR
jgi:hypothetical protein